jgi:hypothetical protein
MYYYKVFDANGELIDKISSRNLKYSYNGKILNCMEDLAQYVWANDQLYRIGWLNIEDPALKGKYPIAQMSVIPKEEYMEYIEKKNSEQK